MKRDDVLGDLDSLLMDSADKFEPADYALFIDAALADLSRLRPLTTQGELTLVADQTLYDAPADLIKPLYSNWGLDKLRRSKPWNPDWIGCLPGIDMVVQSNIRKLLLAPAPTAEQIGIIGAAYAYTYSATYVLADTDAAGNIPDELKQPLLVRALAAAMLALANRGITKPVVVGKAGVGSMPSNGSPAYLAEAYLKLFERLMS
jgi:hypothetical protein